MKNYLLKAVCLVAVAMSSLPITANDYLKIYFKDGHTERHYMKLVESISATKYDLKGTLHSDYQMQQIIMKDTTYSYYIADIDSMSFTKVNEEQLKAEIDNALNTIAPLFQQSPTIEDMETHIDEIKRIKGVEDVWRESLDVVVKFRDWHSLYISYEPEPDMSNIEIITNSLKRVRQMTRMPVMIDGKPIKVAIVNQMDKDVDRPEAKKYLQSLKEEFELLGFDAQYIPDKETLDLDFYKRRMFDYNVIILSTHGSYIGGKHGLLTGVRVPWQYFGLELFSDADDLDDISIGGTWAKDEDDILFSDLACYIRISEDYIKKSKYSFSEKGPHIVFIGACNTMAGDDMLTRAHDGKEVKGSSAVADIFFNKGADVFMGYNDKTNMCNGAAYILFGELMLNGYSLGTALYNLPDEYKDEKKHEASLIDLVNPKSNDKSQNISLHQVQTIDKTEEEVYNEYNKNRKLELKGITSVCTLEETPNVTPKTKIKFGFRLGKEQDVDQLYFYDEFISNDIEFFGEENGKVVFSREVEPYPGLEVFYRAFTYDGIHYNWGEERKFKAILPLMVSTNELSLEVGKTWTVEVTSGCGIYDAWSSNEDVVNVSVNYDVISITALSAGDATITVEDTKSGHTVNIKVTVTAPEEEKPNLSLSITYPINLYIGESRSVIIISGSGSYEVKSSDDDVASVSLEDATVKITAINEGQAIITVTDIQSCQTATLVVTVISGTIPDPGNAWVDLGLPSGTLWATCNVGANSPEEYGGYYTFEEAQAYNSPSLDQIKELLDNCSSVWTSQNGVNGLKFTGPNGGTIFLPAAGTIWDGELRYVGSGGYYWSSTPYDESIGCGFLFVSGDVSLSECFDYRGYGTSVRPVRVRDTQLVTEIALSETSLSLMTGTTQILTAIVQPDNAANKTLEWSSSDVSVATVSASGLVW